MTRIQILTALVRMERPLDVLERELSMHAWDSEEELIHLSVNVMKAVLLKYLTRDTARVDLQHWAELLEGREDVSMSKPVANVIFVLANPTLEGEITLSSVNNLIEQLESASNDSK